MSRRSMVLLSFVALLACAPRSAIARDKAFDVADKVFFDKVHTVVLMPCRFPANFSESDTLAARMEIVRWQLDSLFAQRLQAVGIHAISAREIEAERVRVADSLGGLFDATTGARDTAKANTANLLVRASLVARHGAEAFLDPAVLYTDASFSHGIASWWGAREEIVNESFGRYFAKAFSFKTPDTDLAGTVKALVLFVVVSDVGGQSLYSWGGGLHTTLKLANKKFVPLPRSGFLSDDSKIAKAVELVFAPMDKAARKSGQMKP